MMLHKPHIFASYRNNVLWIPKKHLKIFSDLLKKTHLYIHLYIYTNMYTSQVSNSLRHITTYVSDLDHMKGTYIRSNIFIQTIINLIHSISFLRVQNEGGHFGQDDRYVQLRLCLKNLKAYSIWDLFWCRLLILLKGLVHGLHKEVLIT